MGFPAFFIIDHAGTISAQMDRPAGKDSIGTALVKLINQVESN